LRTRRETRRWKNLPSTNPTAFTGLGMACAAPVKAILHFCFQ
jgi:hypothetical protein